MKEKKEASASNQKPNAEETKNKTSLAANKMGNAPVKRLLIGMAWPAIISMTILSLYNIIDSIFVAMISEKALKAVSIIMPVQMLMISMGVGSSVGVNSLISRRLGAKRFKEADLAASTSIRIGAFNWIVFAVFGILFPRIFVGVYTSDAQIFHYAVQYLEIVTIFSLFSMVEIHVEKVLQATGNMVAPMVISMAGALTNLILDPILIFGLFGFPRLEVMGAAIATVAGQFVSFIVAFYIFKRKKRDVAIRFRGFKFDWGVVRDIYAVGLPAIIMQSIGSIMLFGYNAILAANATAVAVLGAYFKVQSVIFMPVFGLTQGAMPILGYNFGARNRKRLMETYKFALIVAIVIMLVGLTIFQLAPDMLLKLFSADENMMKIGIPALRIISICFPFAAFGIMTSTLFQSTGHGLYSMFASILRQLAGILPIAYLLFHYVGLNASWAAFPLAETIGLTYTLTMVIYLYKKELKNL